MPGPLLVTDAPFLLYRAFFAIPDKITGADGRPVNALLGAVNQTLWCVERFDPRAVVMTFGPESAAYRVEAFPAYHADRPPMPDDLAHQWAQAPALFEAFGWYVMHGGDLEADDVMGTLAKLEAEAGGKTLILTGDRDMFQCVDDHTSVLIQQRGKEPEELTADGVRERYGIGPELVPDFIALRGDPSDGIPGAKGIGEKTAAELLNRHGSLDAAIENAVREKPSVRSALLGQADELRMFRDLATLRTAVVQRPEDAPTDTERAAAAVEALGMRRLASRLRG